MNQAYFKSLLTISPSKPEDRYMFLVDQIDLAANIMNCGFRSIVIATEPEHENFFSIDSFEQCLKEMDDPGNTKLRYIYVPACSSKQINQKLGCCLRAEHLTVRENGWKLFHEKEYLARSEAGAELKKILQAYVDRYEKIPETEPDLDQFHLLGNDGKPTGVCDIAIAEEVCRRMHFFRLEETTFVYQHGVYIEDPTKYFLKTQIRSLMYRKYIKVPTIQRICELIFAIDHVQKQFHDLYNFPAHWVNFQNGFYDPVEQVMIPHDPKHLSVNQINYEFHPGRMKAMLQSGEKVEAFLSMSLPDPMDQQLFWEYLGYSMTTDTSLQKFLMLLGDGGTGKSVLISLFLNSIGMENIASVSLQDLNHRFYPTSLFGKLLDACGDIPCKQMEQTDSLKKIVGEDPILYEKKGNDPLLFQSHAKLLFSANAMPDNLDDKSNAFYRRLLILEMNQKVAPDQRDRNLKEKLYSERGYIIYKAMQSLHRLYERNAFLESENCKKNIEKVQRQSDSVKAFLDEKVETRSGARMERSQMYLLYESYCKENGRHPLGKSRFLEELERKGWIATKSNGKFVFKDLQELDEGFLKADEEDCPFD